VTIADRAPRVDGQNGGGNGPGGNGGDGTPADRTAPAIGRITLKPARFTTVRAKARGARRGTTIRYSLSEPAAVTLRVERKVGRRFKSAGTLKQAGRAGANRKAFTGRIGRKVLRAGTYRLVLTAVDAAGNRSTAKPRSFRIVNR
jgi:hypothetical protein